MTEKILCVDDAPNILAAWQRHLRKRFDIDTALAGEEGLATIESNGPYAVVVSDLRMPGMDGIRFLVRVRERSPDTVRIMVTGNADIDAAIACINEGNIFRFLTKPLKTESMIQALEDALEQHRLITAPRELLENTLSGVIRVLTEVLAPANPLAFSQASRIKRYVQHIAAQLDLPDTWQFEVSAMLSQIGCVTLPLEILQKVHSGEELSPDEARMYASHPTAGRDLLINIPRLEVVAEIVAGQNDPLHTQEGRQDPKQRDLVTLGTQILQAALKFDHLIAGGIPPGVAIKQLSEEPMACDPVIVSALDSLDLGSVDMDATSARVRNLATGMVLDQDVRAKNGTLLAPKGQEITPPLLERLRDFSEEMNIIEPVRVLVRREPALAAQH